MSSSPAPLTAMSGNELAVSGAVMPRDCNAVSRRGIDITSPVAESLRTGGRRTLSAGVRIRATESTAGFGLVGAGGSPAAESTHVFILVSCAFTELSVLARWVAAIAALTESEVGARPGINVVICAPAICGSPAMSAS